ncbi:MAG: AAA family ATPase [Deltaproteobacteria bacterium]|nr:AAA family ATPase [Deltaproteobacteria bacterium]
MYLEFFQFKKSPFHITPDPDFLFLSPSHKEASASILYGIETRKGFIAVTGESGVGKTTIVRSYLEGIDQEKIRLVYIFNAALCFDRLLKQIFSELGIRAAGEDTAELLEILFHYLSDEYGKDRSVVLIIDEAQNMPVETLERLWMLSNPETSQDKLIQIILVGQPEFDARLELSELGQLKERIAIRSRIDPFTPEESIAYIHHRLMRASSFHNPVFTKKALKCIIKEANGIARTINILCDNALVTAFGHQRKLVDEKIVKEVIGNFRGEDPRSGFRWKIVWVPAVVACLAAAVFVSPSVISRFENPPMSKQSFRTKLPEQPPAAAKVRQAKVGGSLANRTESKPTSAFSGTKLSGKSADGEKKVSAAMAVQPNAGIAAKPKTPPGVQGEKVSTGRASEAPAAVGGESPLQKAPESLSEPAKHPAQPNKSPARGTRREGKPLRTLEVKKADSVSQPLVGVMAGWPEVC